MHDNTVYSKYLPLDILKAQEISTYRIPNFCLKVDVGKKKNNEHESTAYNVSSGLSPSFDYDSLLTSIRRKMCRWSYHVVDSFDYERRIVAIAFSYFDRYVASTLDSKKEEGDKTCYILKSQTTLQLACMTSLYIAIKVMCKSEKNIFPMISFVDLSRGLFSIQEMTEMEEKILSSLQYKLYPPITEDFIHHYFDLMPGALFVDKNKNLSENNPSISLAQKLESRLYKRSQRVAEIALCEYCFSSELPSLIALACIYTAVVNEVDVEWLSIDCIDEYFEKVKGLVLDSDNESEMMHFWDVQMNLETIYKRSNFKICKYY